MAIQYRSATASQSSTFINKPAGVVEGDLLLLSMHVGSAPFGLAPAGFTLIRTASLPGETGSGLALTLSTFYKIAGPSEPATYGTFASGASDQSATLVAYSNVHTTFPVQASSGSVGYTGGSFDAPGIATGTADALVVALAARSLNIGIVAPTGTTTRVRANADLVNSELVHVDYPSTTVGVQPVKNWPSTFQSQTAAAFGAQQIVLRHANRPPNAPTLIGPSSTTINKDASNRFSWSHSDPDGDSQSFYDLRYRLIGAVPWTTVAGTTPNQFRDFAAGTFVTGDYEWQVRTYDSAGAQGTYSPSAFFSAAAAPAGPAITDPINGQTLSESSYVLTWSSPDQQEYEASILDADGAVVFTSGTVAEAATRSLLLSFPDNSATRTIRLRTRTAGLWSPYATVTVLVSYTTPAVAGLSVRPISTISASTGTDAILVELANPAPTGGQPAVGSHRIFRRVGFTGDGVRIVVDHPAGQAYVDRTPASGVDYSYRVESIAANGTASTSEWIGDAVDLEPTVPGEPTPGDEGDFADADFATADFD